MKIKICGLKRIADIDYVNQHQPDWIGFVFAGTKRKIDFDTAKKLKEQLNPDIPAVGVFVNAQIDFVIRLVTEHVIDLVQLHGDEDEDYISALRAALSDRLDRNAAIIKAIRVQNSKQVLEAEKLPADYLLLDAFTADEYGGSGKVFDHNLIPPLTKPYLLAGGITSRNVVSILESLKNNPPIGVDVSSSVETDGCKDQEKIREIIEVVHGYQ